MNRCNSFKQTEIGRLPKEWRVVRISNIGKVITGTTPPTKIEEYWGEGYPFVTPTDFSMSKYVNRTERKVTEKGANRGKIIPRDSVMVTCVASVGEVALALSECITNQQINSIICNQKASPHYVYYALLFRKSLLKGWAGITTTPIIKKSLFERFLIPLPPLPEQKKIAEILSTVDEAIEKADQAIERTQRLKEGLMQELLTRGIGRNEFKDMEIGRIPKGWEVVRLGDQSVTELIMGQSPPSSTYNEKGEGLPFFQGKIEFGEIYPTPTFYCSNPIKIAEPHDILPPVGEVNIAPFRCCIGRGLSAIRVKGNKLDYLFLFYLLKFNGKKFETLSAGSTFKAIRRREIENYLIPLPPLPEQKKIAEILSTVDKRLELLRKRKEKLERIKRGLMEDLLTGRRRVKVAQAERS